MPNPSAASSKILSESKKDCKEDDRRDAVFTTHDSMTANPTTKERVAKSRAKRVEAGLVRIDIGRIGDEKGINGYITREQALYLKAKVAAMKAKK